MAGGKAPPRFRYRQLGNLADHRSPISVGSGLAERVAWLLWRPVHILFLIGFRNRLVASLNGPWHCYERGARLSPALTPRPCASRHRPPISALTDGSYRHEPVWYRNFQYDAERERGLDFIEDLASPAVFTWTLNGAWRHPRCEAGSGRALRPLGALAPGGFVNQADGTAWMAMYCLNLMRIALELAQRNHVYEDIARGDRHRHFRRGAGSHLTTKRSLGDVTGRRRADRGACAAARGRGAAPPAGHVHGRLPLRAAARRGRSRVALAGVPAAEAPAGVERFFTTRLPAILSAGPEDFAAALAAALARS